MTLPVIYQTKIILKEMMQKSNLWKTGIGEAFGGNPPYPADFNPFKQGTHRIILSDSTGTAQAEWIPDIPETGKYAVYISYKASDENIDDAEYIIHHAGGEIKFNINQQIGGNTWIYLGTFKFFTGKNSSQGKVVLTNLSKNSGKIVSADAVRFGGGMGVVEINGETSGRPKYLEGARYWLQYAGMPDTLVYSLNNLENDYNDDYQSRAEYGNYLYGAPFGPNKDRNIKGLGIPIDLSLAFHTDAGITKNDTTIGTLSIYGLRDSKREEFFPDGVSRIANRDFADILQTQIVNDLRAKYDTVWNRRQLMEANYSESTRPNVPSVLLELLSHQNFLDMQFALDPRFRFDVSRAIYKAMLRFLSVHYDFEYVVQPLPVTHFSSEFEGDNAVLLRWEPREDPLEVTASPDRYIVYTRIDSGDFDNGVLVYENKTLIKIEEGKIYSFKVTAVNNGGESFSSEILSVCKINNGKNPVLIVNGFNRISGPSKIESNNFSGFTNFIDEGVPDKFDYGFTGTQHDFDPFSEYRSNDAPGHGASHADYETKIIAGNSFDFPFIHGEAVKAAGYSFISSSDESIIDGDIDLNKYSFIDLILGEEKETRWQKPFADSLHGTQFRAFPKKFQEKITNYLNSGGNLFITGAYVGSDLFSGKDSLDIKFAREVLKFNLSTNHAAKTGGVFSTKKINLPDNFNFNTELNDKIYSVEAPDALNPVKDSETLIRYSENSFSAGVGYKNDYGVVVFGFPFETILDSNTRAEIMKEILRYFTGN
jgi:hypothetical protein